MAGARLVDSQPSTIEAAANLDGNGAGSVDRSQLKLRLLTAYLAIAAQDRASIVGGNDDAEHSVRARLDDHPVPLLPARTLHLASFRNYADLTLVHEQVNATSDRLFAEQENEIPALAP